MLPDSIFENTEVAFAVKSNAEIERAYYLFKMIKNEPMVKIGSKITKFALNMHKKLLTKLLTLHLKSLKKLKTEFICHSPCSNLRV